VDAPRHAKTSYAPRHSRPRQRRRYVSAITPATLVAVLAIGTVGAVAVPVLRTPDTRPRVLAEPPRDAVPVGASGSAGLDDSEGSRGSDGEAGDEQVPPGTGPLPPQGDPSSASPGSDGGPDDGATDDGGWTPPGTGSPNSPSPDPTVPGGSGGPGDGSASGVPDPSTVPPTTTSPSAPSQLPTGSTAPTPSDPAPSTSGATPDPTGPLPPPVPPSTPAPDPNGLPVGNLPGWTQVFADDFTRDAPLGSFLTTYAADWSAYPSPWKDTSGNGVYDPARTLSVHDSALDIYVHTENGVHYVSAPTPRLPTMTYGRYSVRFRADAVAGYKTAWLLWPDDNQWPVHGEIDFPEGNLDRTISAFAHWANPTGGQDAYPTTTTYADWHTATTEWTPTGITFYLDGVVIGHSTTLVPSRPMHWVLQTETQLAGGPPSDFAAGHVLVDWVTAYTYTP
jgi:hypothetical protein